MSHSVMVKAARMFAAGGFPVLRFDFSGCGDSEGDLRFSLVEDWLRDLDAAIGVFRRKTGIRRCFLWGLRLGAGLALLGQERDGDVAGLILWQPALNFSTHIRQFLRRAISTQISRSRAGHAGLAPEDELQRHDLTHVIGYPVSKGLYDSFNNMADRPEKTAPTIPTFILSISLMDRPAPVIGNYADRLNRAGLPVALEHVQAEPFWDRYWRWECNQPAEATLRWLRDRS